MMCKMPHGRASRPGEDQPKMEDSMNAITETKRRVEAQSQAEKTAGSVVASSRPDAKLNELCLLLIRRVQAPVYDDPVRAEIAELVNAIWHEPAITVQGVFYKVAAAGACAYMLLGNEHLITKHLESALDNGAVIEAAEDVWDALSAGLESLDKGHPILSLLGAAVLEWEKIEEEAAAA